MSISNGGPLHIENLKKIYATEFPEKKIDVFNSLSYF